MMAMKKTLKMMHLKIAVKAEEMIQLWKPMGNERQIHGLYFIQ
jgi:hypothetical protein